MNLTNKSRAPRIARPGLIREYLSAAVGCAWLIAIVIVGSWVI